MRALQELEAMERRAKEMEERARGMAAELVREKQTKAAEAEDRLREMERLVLSLLFVLRFHVTLRHTGLTHTHAHRPHAHTLAHTGRTRSHHAHTLRLAHSFIISI